MQLSPAIDLLGGKAVRLRQGRYEDVTVYHDAPAELAAAWRGQAGRLHVVDLEGARAGRAEQKTLVRDLVRAFGPGVQVGGGVRSFEAVQSYFDLGVERVVLGTAAIQNPKLVEEATRAYPDQVILAVDARAGKVATAGWLEQSELTAIDLLKQFAELPLAAVLYTDIDRDGMEVGPNVAETARLADATDVPVIASGGVGTLSHLEQLRSASSRIAAAIVGRALHEGRFGLAEARRAALDSSVPLASQS